MKRFDIHHADHFGHVVNLIHECIDSGYSEWHDIRDLVSKHYEVKNWLSIRYVIQAMKDQGIIARYPDVNIEKYIYTKEF